MEGELNVDLNEFQTKYMAVNLNYRGQVKAKEANATLQWLKTNQDATFVEWVSRASRSASTRFSPPATETTTRRRTSTATW